METFGVLLFDGFELLDVFGPLEVFGHMRDEFRLVLIGERAGPVASAQGPRADADVGRADCPPLDVLFVPGGMGTRRGVDDAALLGWIRERAVAASVVMSVCTGSGLLARAGVLDGRRATSNKRAFDWATSQGPAVEWIRRARWVHDDKFWTSSGVSAGIDMALAFVAERHGRDAADAAARRIEYEWHRDPNDDPFA